MEHPEERTQKRYRSRQWLARPGSACAQEPKVAQPRIALVYQDARCAPETGARTTARLSAPPFRKKEPRQIAWSGPGRQRAHRCGDVGAPVASVFLIRIEPVDEGSVRADRPQWLRAVVSILNDIFKNSLWVIASEQRGGKPSAAHRQQAPLDPSCGCLAQRSATTKNRRSRPPRRPARAKRLATHHDQGSSSTATVNAVATGMMTSSTWRSPIRTTTDQSDDDGTPRSRQPEVRGTVAATSPSPWGSSRSGHDDRHRCRLFGVLRGQGGGEPPTRSGRLPAR